MYIMKGLSGGGDVLIFFQDALVCLRYLMQVFAKLHKSLSEGGGCGFRGSTPSISSTICLLILILSSSALRTKGPSH